MLNLCKETSDINELLFTNPLVPNSTFSEYMILHDQNIQNMGIDSCSEYIILTISTYENFLDSNERSFAYFNRQINLDKSCKIFEVIDEINEDVDDEPKNFSSFQSKNEYFLKIKSIISINKLLLKNDDIKCKRKNKNVNVVIIGKYKKGRFPDIEITQETIIKPLRYLLKKDPIIAKQIFLLLIKSIFNYFHSIKSELIYNWTKFFNKIVEQSEQFYLPLLEILLQIIFENFPKPALTELSKKKIFQMAKKSKLYHLGSLILEEMLKNDEYQEFSYQVSTSKRIKTDANNENLIYLSYLNREIDEWEILNRSLFNKISNYPMASKALQYEMKKKYADALKNYQGYINTTSNDEEQEFEFFHESAFKFMEKLGYWNDINKNIETDLKGNINNLKSHWNKWNLIHWLINSEVILHLNKQHEGLHEFYEWITTSNDVQYIEQNFVEELAILSLIENDNNKYQKYIFMQLQNLIKSLKNNFFFSNKNNFNKIFSFHIFTDMINYQNIIKSNDEILIEAEIKNIEHFWTNNEIDDFNNLVLWEKKLALNRFFLNKLKEKQVLNRNLNMITWNIQIKFIEEALNRNNYYMAINLLGLIQNDINKDVDNELFYSTEFLYIQSDYIFYSEKNHNNIEKLEKTLQVLKKLYEFNIKTANFYKIQIKLHEYISEMNFKLLFFFKRDSNIIQGISERTKQLHKEIYHTIDYDSIIEEIKKKCLVSLQTAKGILEKLYKNDNLNYSKDYGIIHFKLAKYCESLKFENNEFAQIFMISTLEAMRLGNKNANSLFSILIQLPYFSTSDAFSMFQEIITTCPAWIFLDFIKPLLMRLSCEYSHTIFELLYKLAQLYPRALIFYLNFFQNKHFNKDNDSTFSKLEFLLQKELLLYRPFIKALHYIIHPTTVKITLLNLINSIKISPKNIVNLLNFINSFIDWYLNSPHSNCGKFFQKILKILKENFAKDIEKLKISTCYSQVDSIAKEMINQLNVIEIPEETFSLIDYSPWLAKFQNYSYKHSIEIPGQYSSYNEPNIPQHITIFRFESKIQVMQSLLKPTKINFIANDGKKYSFLLKMNENLLIDDDVNLIFKTLNLILNQNSNKYPSISTYYFTPINNFLVLQEYIIKGSSLKDIIFENMTKEEEEEYLKIETSHCQWFNDAWNNCKLMSPPQPSLYQSVYIEYSNLSTLSFWNHISKTIPKIILKRSILQMSSNSQEFFILRKNFTETYAVMSAAHWVLGIGDRHLSNCIISKNNAKCFGIDFKHVFDSAIIDCKEVEIMPLRLTPVIQEILEPLKEHGLFRDIMINTLKLIQANKELLLEILKVEIYQQMNNCSQEQDLNDTFKNEIINLKLIGTCPVSIIKKELNQNKHIDKLLFNKYCNLLEEIDEFRIMDDDIVVEKQVFV